MNTRLSPALALLVLCSTGGLLLAQPAPVPLVDPKADALLKQMCQTLAAAKQLTFESTNLSDEVTPTGQKLQFQKQVTISVRRPDGINAVVKGDRENFTAIYDGKTVTFHDPTQNQYATAPMPPTIDDTLDTLATKYGLVAPLADFLFSNPQESFTARLQAGLYIGTANVGDAVCDHLAFRGEAIDFQLWVERREKPVPRKIVITYKNIPGEPQFMAIMDKWDLAANIPPERFKFTPPPGAKQIELKPLPTTQPGR